MRAVLQRVLSASVSVEGRVTGSIGRGLLVLAAVGPGDTDEDFRWLAGKIVRMRIFSDPEGKMNLAAGEVGGEILLVSQFTLFASTKKGNRPSFHLSAPPGEALRRFEDFRRILEAEWGKPVAAGEFGADMQVALINDGPVTIVMDSADPE